MVEGFAVIPFSVVEVDHRSLNNATAVLFRIAAFPERVASGTTCLIKRLGYETRERRKTESMRWRPIAT